MRIRRAASRVKGVQYVVQGSDGTVGQQGMKAALTQTK